ncbi:hypothetical protein GPJ56_011117 [Histomonas meleagridis]|nr:hypothetical protein GPJ56_011117 [Histomonas meleagridis]
MDDSLDDILHETEAIERNYKNDSSMTIGISQLSDFFKRIEKDQTSNLNGQFLLAQQGIDSAKTERVIKEMEESLRSEQSEPNLMQSKEAIQSTKIPRTALELFERSTRNELDDEWDSITQDLMNMAENTIPNYKIPSSHFFPTQGSLYSSYSEEAVIFARNVQSTPLPTAPEILERSIQSLDEYSKLHPLSGNNQVKLDYFIALRYILQNVIDDLSDLSLKTHLMIIGSLDFLHHQFMTINFPSKTELTESDIDLYVSKNFPNAKAPWANIWIAIRSGNFEVVKQICRNYPETNEFLEHFENFVLEGNAPTSSAKNCSVLNDTLQSTPEEQFKLQCYSFAVGFELQHPQTSAMDTIEDYLFCVLSPLRFGCDSGSLVDIQNIIR